MKRIYVDMDGVLCDFSKARKAELERDPTQAYPQAQFGFWMDLEPIDGAIEAFNALSAVYDVWILSRPSFDNLNSFTEKAYWVKKYFGPDILRKLILCRNKSLLIGDYLIDDCVNAHQRDFQGKFIHFGTEEFPNWIKVLQWFALEKPNAN
jgi:5'(3')-deoxyribonucleotidase